MKLPVKYPNFFIHLSVYISTVIRFILNALLVLILFALLVGIYKSGYDLFHSLNDSMESILQKMLLDSVFIVALIEVALTIIGYLRDGNVHVRYIVDTILIIMLNEIVSLWFKHPKLTDMIGISVIILSLAVVRVSVIKLAPGESLGRTQPKA